jgi:Outer membrane protein
MLKTLFLAITLSSCLHTTIKGQEQLDYYIDAAVANSPLLYAKKNDLRGASLDSASVRATYLPQVGFTANVAYDPIINGLGYDEVITNKQQGSTLVHFDMLLPGNRMLKAQNSFAALNRRSLSLDYSLTVKDLKQQVTNQYLVVYGDQQQLAFLKESYQLLQREDSILQRLARANIYRQTDYLTFVASMRKQQLLKMQALSQLKSNLGRLRYLCGIEDTSLVSLSKPNLPLAELVNVDSTLTTRKFTADSLLIASKHSMIDAYYRPTFSLHADAGYLSSFLFEPYNNFGVGVGATFSIPIYDGHQRTLQHQKVVLQEQSLGFEKGKVIRQQQIQRRLLQSQLNDLALQSKEVDEQLSFARALVEANGRLLESGQVDIPMFFLSIQSYMDLEGQRWSAEIARYMLINELNNISE